MRNIFFIIVFLFGCSLSQSDQSISSNIQESYDDISINLNFYCYREGFVVYSYIDNFEFLSKYKRNIEMIRRDLLDVQQKMKVKELIKSSQFVEKPKITINVKKNNGSFQVYVNYVNHTLQNNSCYINLENLNDISSYIEQIDFLLEEINRLEEMKIMEKDELHNK